MKISLYDAWKHLNEIQFKVVYRNRVLEIKADSYRREFFVLNGESIDFCNCFDCTKSIMVELYNPLQTNKPEWF